VIDLVLDAVVVQGVLDGRWARTECGALDSSKSNAAKDRTVSAPTRQYTKPQAGQLGLAPVRAASLLVLACLLSSGCLFTAPSRDGATTDPTSCAPDTYRLGPAGCVSYHNYVLEVFGFGEGSYSVGVPFPHGDWCLQPDQWVLQDGAENAVGELRHVERGDVAWITAQGSSHIAWRVNVTGRATCQTFRYDPWSTDPDPSNETVEVKAEGSARITVAVSEPNGACTPVTQYAGNVTAGWTMLPKVFEDTACA
jgi:hypothetical protein